MFVETWEQASCRLSDAPETFPKSIRDRCRLVSKVYTEPGSRGQGQATFLMHKVIAKANEAGICLLLTPGEYDEGGPNDEQLERWYAKLGFVRVQDDPVVMAHYPPARR